MSDRRDLYRAAHENSATGTYNESGMKTGDMRFEETTAIVTGGMSGIGRAIAIKLADEGASMMIGDILAEPPQGARYQTEAKKPTHEVIREAGGNSAFERIDVSNPKECEVLVDRAVSEFGGLDLLVNNAGIHIEGGYDDLSVDDWQQVLNVNLSGQFYCTKAAVPFLRESEGSIVNVGSVHAIDGGAGPPYAASKAGVVNMTKDMAVWLSGDGINANAVCPGYIKTPMNDKLDDEIVEEAREGVLIDRLGEPEDVANAVVFFASDAAEWITGEALFVDGGRTAHR